MEKTIRHRSPGVILVVMLIAMTTGAVCMNKVAPVLTNITEDLNITSSTQAGLLMSIFTFTGIFLSIPMGMLITKYGTFRTGLLSILAIVIGSAAGALAPNFGVMIVSRLVEGLGLMFLGAIGPAAVASAFSNKNSGSAMGLLMCYMSFGQIIALNIAPVVAQKSSWRNFWWISAACGAVALVLWIFVMKDFRDPERAADQADGQAREGSAATLGQVLKNKSVWCVCITFFTFMVVHFGVFNYLPTYMSTVCGISQTTAGTLTSIASLIGIPVGIAGGVIADRIGSVKKPLAATMILMAVVVAVTPLFSAGNFTIYVILYGLVAMAEAGLSFTAITRVVRPMETAVASAALNTAQWLGAFLSTIVFGALLDQFGWNTTYYIMVPILAVGILTTLLNRKLK